MKRPKQLTADTIRGRARITVTMPVPPLSDRRPFRGPDDVIPRVPRPAINVAILLTEEGVCPETLDALRSALRGAGFVVEE